MPGYPCLKHSAVRSSPHACPCGRGQPDEPAGFSEDGQGIPDRLRFVDNGRAAVDAFQTWHPDLIFMDISMPEMDGREAAAAIRTVEAGVRTFPSSR